MRLAKFAGIWLAGLLAIVLLVNTAGFAFTKITGADILMPSMLGYSKKMRLPLAEAATDDERKQNSAILSMRSILSNVRFSNMTENKLLGMLLFSDLTIDQSIVFFGEQGMNPFSTGVFQIVYQDGTERRHFVNTAGLIDLEALCESGCGETLAQALAQTPDALVRLDAYTIDNYLITPAKLTVLDADGNTLTQIDCPAQGEILTAEDLYVENSGAGSDYDSYSLSWQLSNAMLGQRRSDRIAADLAAQADPSGSDVSGEIRTHYGFGSFTSEFTEVIDHNAEICVCTFDFHRSLILCSALLGAIFTVILVIVFLARR